MKPTGWIALVLALVGLAVWLSLVGRDQVPEPVVDGQHASAWVAHWSEGNYETRAAAREALSSLGSLAIPYLCAGLEKAEPPFKRARNAWGKWFPRWSFTFTDAAVARERSARLLGEMGAVAGPAAPLLVEKLVDPNVNVRLEAALALRRIGPAAVNELLRTLQHREARCRAAAAAELVNFKSPLEEIVAALRQRFTDRDPTVRCKAIAALGILGRDHPSTFAGLLAALMDLEPAVRSTAIQAISLGGSKSRPALAALRNATKDPHVIVRVQAAAALWEIDGDADGAVPVLVSALSARDISWHAAFLLGRIGPSAAAAVPALIRLMQTEQVSRPLRMPPSSAMALGNIGTAAVPDLMKVLNDRRLWVQASAAMALGFIGREARAAAGQLLELANSPDSELRQAAALSLGRIDPENPRLLPVLVEMAQEDDIYIRGSALSLLRQIDPGKAAELGSE